MMCLQSGKVTNIIKTKHIHLTAGGKNLKTKCVTNKIINYSKILLIEIQLHYLLICLQVFLINLHILFLARLPDHFKFVHVMRMDPCCMTSPVFLVNSCSKAGALA